MAILQQFQVFLMILLFTAFSLVIWGLQIGLATLLSIPKYFSGGRGTGKYGGHQKKF